MAAPISKMNGRTVVIELDGPAGLTLADLRSLADAFEAAGATEAARAIVVAGPAGTFCAGGDLLDFLACGDLDELARVVRRFMKTINEVEIPMIAAVDGAAVGLGMTMLMHFDAVFATPDSSFVAPFTDLGLVPECGATLLAPARFGHMRAFELLCMGSALTALEARDIGLVSEVTAPGSATAAALAAASRVAKKPATALKMTRRLLRGDRAAIALRIDEEITQFRAQLEDAAITRRLSRIAKSPRPKQAA